MNKKGFIDFIELDEDVVYNPAFWVLTALGYVGAILSFAAITGVEKLRPLTTWIGGEELVTQYAMPIYIKLPVLLGILILVPVATYLIIIKFS